MKSVQIRWAAATETATGSSSRRSVIVTTSGFLIEETETDYIIARDWCETLGIAKSMLAIPKCCVIADVINLPLGTCRKPGIV